MRKMNSIYAMAAMMGGVLMSMESTKRGPLGFISHDAIDRDTRNRQIEIGRRNTMQKHGLREFSFEQGTIWARNYKNAERKAKNKGWVA